MTQREAPNRRLTFAELIRTSAATAMDNKIKRFNNIIDGHESKETGEITWHMSELREAITLGRELGGGRHERAVALMFEHILMLGAVQTHESITISGTELFAAKHKIPEKTQQEIAAKACDYFMTDTVDQENRSSQLKVALRIAKTFKLESAVPGIERALAEEEEKENAAKEGRRQKLLEKLISVKAGIVKQPELLGDMLRLLIEREGTNYTLLAARIKVDSSETYGFISVRGVPSREKLDKIAAELNLSEEEVRLLDDARLRLMDRGVKEAA